MTSPSPWKREILEPQNPGIGPAMVIDYLFSSPGGDIPLQPHDLERPFLLAPSKPHPFLTLGDYFRAIERFVLRHEENPLKALEVGLIERIGHHRIDRLRIRSEKHGTLYHVASVEFLADGTSVRAAVSTAVSETARGCLSREYQVLKALSQSYSLPYLPKVYDKAEIICPDGRLPHQTLTLMLSEWFEDYHEWHLSVDPEDNRQKIRIWDLKNGYRYATEEETFHIFRQASGILTRYYDPRTAKQIYPWRHAAGDFVVGFRPAGIQTRLTTARDYRSLMDFLSEDPVHPTIAMVYFLLNLTVQMRMDRLDGIGEAAWAGELAVQAAVEGFLESLRTMDGKRGLTKTERQTLLSLIRSLRKDELERLYQPLAAFYERECPDDEFRLIHTHLNPHITSLYEVIQRVA